MNSSTTVFNVARTREIFSQALFNDIILKYTNSNTFKALKIVQSNSSTFKVFSTHTKVGRYTGIHASTGSTGTGTRHYP